MRNIVVIFSIFIGFIGYGQLAVGKEMADPFCILDFNEDGDKGIILPYVNKTEMEMLETSVNGTLYFDANKSKVKLIENGEIKDLSVKRIANQEKKFNVNLKSFEKFKESSVTQGGIIGGTSSTLGVLVLESQNMALGMPSTTDYKNIVNPAHGMMVYDSTINKLCVYDGEKWAFWGR